MTAATWTFYEKDGETEILTVPGYVSVRAEGNAERILKFMLTDEADYAALMAMCANAEPYYSSRVSLKCGELFVDKSPSQMNTIKVVDPDAVNSGFGILYDHQPQRIAGMGDHTWLFELTLLWMGDTLGDELEDGVFVIRPGTGYSGFTYYFPLMFS